jgi:pimeloyl-ACP methyl ester carboxylesterase
LQFDSLFAPFLQTNDVIVFDQRGVGYSQPVLDCTEATDFAYNTLDKELSADEYVQQYDDVLKACGQRLIGQSIDVAAFNSAESASDINDMRTALGYNQLNLFGISYGTRLALTVMRDHPDAVRSVIIDSVVPLQGSYFDAAKTAQRVLDTLFSGCKTNTACNTAYPDLENVFYGLINQFNAQPITVQVPNLRQGGKQANAVIDGDALAGLMFQAFYITDLIPSLPQSIYDIQKGDYTFITTITTLQLFQLNYVSSGMYMAVQCKEELPFDTADTINAILEQTRPELKGFVRRQLIDPSALDVCATWGEGAPNPIENQPVVSDIPTLVLSGEYDPITPPDYGKLVAQTLSKSFFFEFPGTGHGVVPSSQCALGMALVFIADPTNSPDSKCLADVKEPDFTTPGSVDQSAPVTMIPYNGVGFIGVAPDGWKELIPGTFSRAKNGVDQAALAYQVIPGVTTELALPLLSSQFGITDTVGTSRVANGLVWKLYQGDFGGLKVDIAMADGSNRVYIIILLSNNAAERETLYEQVFLPAIDALQPLA